MLRPTVKPPFSPTTFRPKVTQVTPFFLDPARAQVGSSQGHPGQRLTPWAPKVKVTPWGPKVPP